MSYTKGKFLILSIYHITVKELTYKVKVLQIKTENNLKT